MKQIIVLRHAKAGDHTGDDHERQLVPKGIKSCKLIGKYMKENNILSQKVISSTAKRAHQTAENVIKNAGYDTKIDLSKFLYLATPGEIFKEIAKVDDSINSIMIVGHNPGLHLFSVNLIGKGKTDLITKISTNFPTAAFAVFSVEKDSWKDISVGDGQIDHFTFPKEL